jgi:3-phosphoshikimate 1-carboxyvinyltransferase
MDVIGVSKKNGIIHGEVTLPRSKSISNRLLIIHALANFDLSIQGLSESEDTRILLNLLHMIRSGQKGQEPVTVDCRNAGTAFRFLTALLAMTPGQWYLTGTARMKERPVGILVESLRQLGSVISCLENEGYPPLLIEGKHLSGRQIRIESVVSSQFISALLMIAPALPGGLKLVLEYPQSSAPYIDMTLKLLDFYGVKSVHEGDMIIVPGQPYRFNEISVEYDWSSAAFWYEMVAFSDKADLVLKNLVRESLQGDAILPDIFDSFGVKTSFRKDGAHLSMHGRKVSRFEFDFSDHPDLALPVIVTSAGLNIPFTISGLKNLRIKESDRISAVRSELSKIGFETHLIRDDVLIYRGENRNQGLFSRGDGKINRICTYDDHRIAMSFAPLALVEGYLEIENPDVVAKSYPGFWAEAQKTVFTYSRRV